VAGNSRNDLIEGGWFYKIGYMKISDLIAFVVVPVVALAFSSCASAPEDGQPNYPAPNNADNASKLQDAHSKFLRNAN